MQADPRILLADIDRASADIESFTEGMDTSAYVADGLTQAAVERKCGVIGGAVNGLLKSHPDLAVRIPESHKIVAFRNVLAHGFAHMVPEVVWDYVQNHLPQLRQVVRTLLAELGPVEG